MRVMAFTAWYVGKPATQHECQTDQDFIDAWTALDSDGVLAFKFFFDSVRGGTRDAQHLNGNDYYWIQPTANGVAFGHSDDPVDTIVTRYPGALIKRGMWTTPAEMQQVITDQAAATYWADAPIQVNLGGCC